MKKTFFTILLISVIGLLSCHKKSNELNIQQYDLQQIQAYIASHGLTKMVRDTSGGDTTGMYYQILTPGNSTAKNTSGQPLWQLTDTSKISMVFTLSSFDGKYTSTDTFTNHYCEYIGHLVTGGLPAGLQTALISDLKYNGGSIRILIPSRMAYGINGNGTGSNENANSHILGNQCLDYYAHLVINEPAYDDLVINNYMTAQNFKNYPKTSSGLYYEVLSKGASTKTIDSNSIVEVTYTGQLFDGTIFDGANNGPDSVSLQIPNLIEGMQQGLAYATGGSTSIRLLIPSALGYGTTGSTGIPVNSCLRFDVVVYSVSP
jgi:FKBP-type peptidyl-prolyl cis-trans isomerase FkpA